MSVERLFVAVVTSTHEINEFAVRRNTGYIHGILVILPVKVGPFKKEILLNDDVIQESSGETALRGSTSFISAMAWLRSFSSPVAATMQSLSHWRTNFSAGCRLSGDWELSPRYQDQNALCSSAEQCIIFTFYIISFIYCFIREKCQKIPYSQWFK